MQATSEAQHLSVWIAYWAGCVLTLLFKWSKAVYLGKKSGKTMKQTSIEWFFEPTLENASSWTATIGGVWVLGTIYIERIVDISGLTSIPVHPSFAFFLATIFEFTVPSLTKWVVSKIPTPQ